MTSLEIQQVDSHEIVYRPNFEPVAVVLEGRDTAGKSGTIRELTHYLPVDKFSVNLSAKPNAETMANWLGYWESKLPNRPQIVFYDRSWYSRAMVQHINNWCTPEQYENFMGSSVNAWEAAQPCKNCSGCQSVKKSSAIALKSVVLLHSSFGSYRQMMSVLSRTTMR